MSDTRGTGFLLGLAADCERRSAHFLRQGRVTSAEPFVMICEQAGN